MTDRDQIAFLTARLDQAEAALAVVTRKLRTAADSFKGGIMETMFLDFRASAPEVAAEVAARAGRFCPLCRRELVTQAMIDEGTAGAHGSTYDVRSNLSLCWEAGGARCDGWVRFGINSDRQAGETAATAPPQEGAMKRT